MLGRPVELRVRGGRDCYGARGRAGVVPEQPRRRLRAHGGMGQRAGRTVLLARGENQDYDFVASWLDQDTRSYAPVQLKELVPAPLNPSASIEGLISSLGKYVDSRNLTVVIHLNQRKRFNLGELRIPKLAIAGLWMFGAVNPDQSSWGLWGDFLASPEESIHGHPAA